MLLATPTSEAEKSQRNVHVNGHDYILREYVGNMPLRGKYVEGNEKNDNGMPQGFLVYQPPGSVTPPHFHETNQFQVFVSLGRFLLAMVLRSSFPWASAPLCDHGSSHDWKDCVGPAYW